MLFLELRSRKKTKHVSNRNIIATLVVDRNAERICLFYYHGDRDGCARRFSVEVSSAVVEVLGHVGEGFVAELTLVKGVCSMGLPARHRKKRGNRAERSYQLWVSHSHLGFCGVNKPLTCA